MLEVRQGFEGRWEELLEGTLGRQVERFQRHVVGREGAAAHDVEHHVHAVFVKLHQLRHALAVVGVHGSMGGEHGLYVELAHLAQGS